MTSYNYTTGNSLTGVVTRAYSYDTNKRLISVTENGVTQSISGYDALGNPSSYKGKTLTWTRGRMLASSGCRFTIQLLQSHGVNEKEVKAKQGSV